jgi:hypothetical protein
MEKEEYFSHAFHLTVRIILILGKLLFGTDYASLYRVFVY